MVQREDRGGPDRQLGAFAHVDQTDAEVFIERLDDMHALDAFRDYKRKTFGLMRLAPGMKIADVGCGTGEDARALSGLVAPAGAITGFDLSEAMIAEARTRHSGQAGLSFTCAPSDALGLPDNSLDAIRADRVLIHVPDPAAALDEMIRVTRPGGRIVVSEPDMPGLWIASSDYRTTDMVVRAIAGSCVTPYLPRDLWAMFQDRKLRDVEYLVQPIVAFELSAAAKILDFKAVLEAMVQKGLLDQGQAAAWLGDMQDRGQNRRFVGGLNIVIASATKP